MLYWRKNRREKGFRWHRWRRPWALMRRTGERLGEQNGPPGLLLSVGNSINSRLNHKMSELLYHVQTSTTWWFLTLYTCRSLSKLYSLIDCFSMFWETYPCSVYNFSVSKVTSLTKYSFLLPKAFETYCMEVGKLTKCHVVVLFEIAALDERNNCG